MTQDVEMAEKKSDSHTPAKAAASTVAQRPAGKTLKKSDGIYTFVGIGVSKVAGGTSTKKHHAGK